MPYSSLLGSTVDTCVSLRGWSSWSFSFVVLRPLMLDIMAGMNQKDSFMRGF